MDTKKLPQEKATKSQVKDWLGSLKTEFKNSTKGFKIFTVIMAFIAIVTIPIGGLLVMPFLWAFITCFILVGRHLLYEVKSKIDKSKNPKAFRTKPALVSVGALAFVTMIGTAMLSSANSSNNANNTSTVTKQEPTAKKTEEKTEKVVEEKPKVDASKAQDPNYKSGQLMSVTRVVDGDTIYTAQHKIRIIGLDTPETVHPSKPVECFGAEASNKMKELVSGKNVYLVADPTQDSIDKYGRHLFHVYLEDGTNVAYEMINQGFGHEYTYNSNPHQYQSQYRAAQTSARENGRGLWSTSTCSGNTTAPQAQQAAPAPASTPAPQPAPQPQAVAPAPQPAPVQSSGGAFPNCRAAWAAGAAPVYAGQPGYGPHLDRDGDGVGCERRPRGF